jgi:D-alanyl-D-alanine carboxypeptidase
VRRLPTIALFAAVGHFVFTLPSAVPLATRDSRLVTPQDTGRIREALLRIESQLGTRMAEDQVPGAAVVLVSGSGFHRVITRGVRDLQSRDPVTGHTLFEIGSLSKTITAIALLQMREEGLIELDRPIDAYLSWFRPPASSGVMTLHQLLTHTAGLPRDRDDIPSSPYAAAGLRERGLGTRPGGRFAYSNL